MDPARRYAPSRRALHWLMFLGVVLAFVFIEGREWFERGTPARLAMVQAHFWVGITLLALMLPRLLLAFSRPAPAVLPALPAWQEMPAKAVHLLLYAMLVAQPVLGLLTAWTDGKQILLPFTGVVLPALMAPSEAMALSMARGEPCDSMAMERDVGQPVLCHQHCLNAPQSLDSPQVPVVSLPAALWVLVVPLLTEATEDIAVLRAEVGQTRPPPDPVFLSTLRLRV